MGSCQYGHPQKKNRIWPIWAIFVHMGVPFFAFLFAFKKDGNIFVDPSPYTINLLIV